MHLKGIRYQNTASLYDVVTNGESPPPLPDDHTSIYLFIVHLSDCLSPTSVGAPATTL